MENKDNIKEAVQQRIEAEKEEQKEEKDELKDEFIITCLNSSELGDGILYSYLLRDKLLYVDNIKRWKIWNGVYWENDNKKNSYARSQVERVVEAYAKLYEKNEISLREREKTIEDKQKEKEIEKDIDIQRNLKKEIDKFKKTNNLLLSQNGTLFKRIQKLRTVNGQKNCLDMAISNENPISIDGKEFDKKRFLLPCKNGVLNLKTGEFQKARQDDYFSFASPVEFPENLPNLDDETIRDLCPVFHSFLERSLVSQETIKYLQKLLGYALTGANTERIFIVFYGTGGQNGKGTIAEVMYHIFGDFAWSISSDLVVETKAFADPDKPSPATMALKGRRFVFASETKDYNAFDEGKIKKLSGGETLSGRTAYQDEENFKPSHTLFLLTNTVPRATGTDEAFGHRFRIVNFPNSFISNPDPDKPYQLKADGKIEEKLIAEASGILVWLLKGALKWQEDDHLIPPAEILKLSQEHQEEGNEVGRFMKAYTKEEEGAMISSIELYENFILWLQDGDLKRKVPTQASFGRKLTSLRYEKKKSTGGKYHYLNIRLKNTLELRSEEIPLLNKDENSLF